MAIRKWELVNRTSKIVNNQITFTFLEPFALCLTPGTAFCLCLYPRNLRYMNV